MAALRRRNKRTQLTEEMKLRIRHIALAATAALAAAACNVTRKLPEGEYLLQKVKIEEDTSAPRHERITADELDNYVRQSPNKRIFGINFYAWVYNLADPDKDNWWRRPSCPTWSRRASRCATSEHISTREDTSPPM